ncbi:MULTISPECIES: S24 family peptidase [Sphingobium]|uniref:Peptidase S24/S26A/S26B/S26C domain-containing protein n=1 Tax=Sphingobium xenophagum TaxID=121428 RepID=A0A401J072_SPHXE|nr:MULTISPECIES: S24 family peptidase [Sphingobium]MBG6117648.1 phage repressor protein C with HTH and peptisase S24 domain [Sphingobium sp. JAI105]PSO12725.1 peptidase S24 [Sphingobium sp. AEW4]TWD09921.1 phage repressor protein C with HTH and peptisase S24 domain [Sphingobium sp. AEW010]TWD26592.1 phage repressor protein C with HTH and peptisase S24 domain [Sphingobium sp. AEW013]TWD27639.1 phage repressor protein C with HTH and peptisase S24 domain [Sphingobium sp. AEW001]
MDESQNARIALDRLIAERGENYADLSRLIGRNPAYIQQFIKRGTPRKLDEADRHVLARYFGVAEQMLGGNAAPVPVPARTRGMPAVVAVPRLALGASAGVGTLDEDERTAGVMAFDAHWLRHLGVRPQRVSIIRVDGESMAPTLSDGDDIMVDHDDDATRLRDGVYVLRLDGVLMVKRIAMGPLRGRFSVVSDNLHYPDWTDIDPALVDIVGRVVWTGRRLV